MARSHKRIWFPTIKPACRLTHMNFIRQWTRHDVDPATIFISLSIKQTTLQNEFDSAMNTVRCRSQSCVPFRRAPPFPPPDLCPTPCPLYEISCFSALTYTLALLLPYLATNIRHADFQTFLSTTDSHSKLINYDELARFAYVSNNYQITVR